MNLIATGDNLYHDAVIKDGKQKDGSYDYNYIYENIKKLLNQAILL